MTLLYIVFGILLFLIPGFLISLFFFNDIKLFERSLISFTLSIPVFLVIYLINLYLLSRFFERSYFGLFILYLLSLSVLIYFLSDEIERLNSKILSRFNFFKRFNNKENSDKGFKETKRKEDDKLSKKEMKKVKELTKNN